VGGRIGGDAGLLLGMPGGLSPGVFSQDQILGKPPAPLRNKTLNLLIFPIEPSLVGTL
jgi:hypothetical protein